MNIGIFFASTTGNTKSVAQLINEKLEAIISDAYINIVDIASDGVRSMIAFNVIIIGVSTWDLGDLQYDWADVMDDLSTLDLQGKSVAIFGLGDQEGYTDTFVDGMGIMANLVRQCGAQLVGLTSIEGYSFEESTAVEDGKFLGLAIDEDNQSDQTEQRVVAWCKQLKKELDL
jgi:flavodoxin I